MRLRLKKVAKKYAIVLIIGVAYLVWVLCTDLKIPCIINVITGYDCPACGVTRMFVALFRLDFVAAYNYNKYLMINGPIILALIFYSDYRYIRTGSANLGWLNVILWLEIIMALAFGVLRNAI